MAPSNGHPLRAAFDRLLSELGAVTGQSLTSDEMAQCALVAPGDRELIIALLDGGRLSLRMPLCRAESVATLQSALAINYGGLPDAVFLALDEQSGQLMQLLIRPIADLAAPEFLSTVAEFIELAPELRRRLLSNAQPMLQNDQPAETIGAMIRA